MKSGHDGGSADHGLDGLIDRQHLIELIHRFARLIDTQGFSELGAVFANDVVWEPPHNLPVCTGLDATVAYMRAGIAAFGAVQHMFTNILVDLDGDTATIRANQVAVHVHPGGEASKHFDAGLAYRLDAVRTSVGWRLNHVMMAVIWASGDRESPAVTALMR